MKLTRRGLLSLTAGAGLAGGFTKVSNALNSLARITEPPQFITAITEDGPIALTRSGSRWQSPGLEIQLENGDVVLRAPSIPVLRIHLRWHFNVPAGLRYLGDAWERSYGDLAWRSMEPERILPWCFFCYDGQTLAACGVKTSPKAFCFWQVDSAGVSLWLDVRNGGRGVRLGGREITLASIVVRSYPEVKPFHAAQLFYHELCEKPRLPSAPMYGGNNWYYAYGNSSAEDIRADSERIASFASSPANRPYMVIDDGWQLNSTAGPWVGNRRFPDMAGLAKDMRRIGVQPGLWIRPLYTKEKISPIWQLGGRAFTLDPSLPEVLDKVKTDIRTVVAWGYSLVKHDFSTYDVLGRWGNAMGDTLADSNWSFANPTLTTAEVISAFYAALREAAGNATLIGCNTVGHLAAGWFEAQRTGDDTSGRDWNRTRRMGVNTLAFRAPQHGAFFAVDADCVGLTKQVPWEMNRQWLDLLARSGTALFVSAAPDAVGPEQRTAIKEAFAAASREQTVGEPLDWMDNNQPERWLLNGRITVYDWFGREGRARGVPLRPAAV